MRMLYYISLVRLYKKELKAKTPMKILDSIGFRDSCDELKIMIQISGNKLTPMQNPASLNIKGLQGS